MINFVNNRIFPINCRNDNRKKPGNPDNPLLLFPSGSMVKGLHFREVASKANQTRNARYC